MAIPYVTTINVGRNILSDEVGFQQTDLKFSFDVPTISYTVRSNGVGFDTGIELERKELTVLKYSTENVASLANMTVQEMRVMLENTENTVELLYTDLNQEGANRINIYGLSETGEWTPYSS
jgi:hypothetical protein